MAEKDIERLLKKNKWQLIIGFLGLALILISFFLITQSSDSGVEIISVDEEESETIFIDLGGAVQKPGLYELPSNSRLNDLFIKADGLALDADREWVEKNLNLAQKLEDGTKLYIPFESDDGNILKASVSEGKININTASLGELDTLWGIGEKRASSIIDNRPYQSIDDLIKEKIISQDVFEKIKEEISVY